MPPGRWHVRPAEATSLSDSSWWDPEGFWYGLHTLLDPVRVPYFRSALADYPRPAPLVLDVGSGAGFVATGLADLARIVAIDESHTALRETHGAGVPSVAAADAGLLPFADQTFDAVICSEVLEHVADPELVLKEAARVLVAGGLFLFSTPLRSYLTRQVLINAAQRWWPTRVLPSDLHEWDRFLTREELGELLGGNGFEVRDILGLTVRARKWPRMITALVLLKMGRISYAEAGERVELMLTKSNSLAMIGCAERIRSR